MRLSESNPFLSIAKHYAAPYSMVLLLSDWYENDGAVMHYHWQRKAYQDSLVHQHGADIRLAVVRANKESIAVQRRNGRK